MNTGSLPITPTQQIAVIAIKIKHKHILKESTFTLPLYHELSARNNSTPRHMGRGLAGHPRSVKLGSGDNKTRLHSPICLKTPAIWQHGLHLGSGQRRPECRGDGFAGERSHRNSSPSSESGFYSCSKKDGVPRRMELSRSKKDGGLRPILDLRHMNRILMNRPFRMITLKQILLQICPGDWLFSLKDAYFPHPDSPPPQAILEIHLRGNGLSIHGPSLWAVPGSPHFYEVHGCCSFPAETDGKPHFELPRRLTHSGQVGGRATISEIRPAQPLMALFHSWYGTVLHGSLRHGTAQFGSVCVSTAV